MGEGALPGVEMFSLRGKVALVTGAGGGLGRRMAMALAGAGADVALIDRDAAVLKEVADLIGQGEGRCMALTVDVTQPAEVNEMVASVVATLGRLDIAVNAAGVNCRKMALEFTEEDWDRVIDVNLKGVFLCSQAEGRVMTAQGSGHIINISSLTAEVGLVRRAVYVASKGGVASLTRALAAEWSRYGVTVNCIGPGHMLTPMTADILGPQKAQEALSARIPAGRVGYPEDLDGAVVFLASDASAYVTGQTIFVDGGYLLNPV